MMRLFLVPVFVALVFLEIGEFARFNDFIAFAVFAIASFTDYLDGHLARKWNMVTDFGKLFDSAADKLLCGSALMVLIYGVCRSDYMPRTVYDGVPFGCREQKRHHRGGYAG